MLSLPNRLASDHKKQTLQLFLSLLLIGCLLYPAANALLAQALQPSGQTVRTILPSEWSVPHPAGMAFSAKYSQIHLIEKSSVKVSPLLGVDIVTITPLGYFVNTTHIDYVIGDSVNLAYADDGDRLFLLSKDAHQLAQVKRTESGVLDPATLTEFDLSALGLRQPKGMSVDATGKYLYILDGVGPRLLRVPLRVGSGIDATQTQRIDLAALGISEARGVAIHPLSGNIYVGNPTAHTLYEVTSSATLVKVYNLSGLTMVDQQSLLFAPSADLTDDPAQLHLFIADSNVPGQASTPTENGSLENGLAETSTAIATAPTATAIVTAVPTDTPIATSPATSTPIATAPTAVVTPTAPATSTPIATAPTVTATAVVTPTSATPGATATTASPTATTNATPTNTVATPIPGATTPSPTTPTATVTTPTPTKSTTPTVVSSTPTIATTMTATATRVPATPTTASSTATPTGQVQAVYLPLIARAGGQDVFRFGRVLEVVLE